MVGVPGRSKGCHTCRKRRIKCDEAKPECQRCEKSGYTCAGYENPLHFRIAVPNLNPTVIALQPQRRNSIAERIKTPVPPSLSLIAFQPDMCHTFLFENFVWRGYGHRWLPLATSGKISPLALQASTALSQRNFGNFYYQDDIKIEGSIQYGKAVQSLIPELSNPMKVGSEALIVPIMLLLIHDSLLADQVGSISHVRGLVQLLMIYGPERFQQEPLRGAFESCRATLITVGIISKRRCFLEEEKWQKLPWAAEPQSKSPQSYLADILVTVPGMLEDDVLLGQYDDSPARAALIDRAEQQLLKLFDWRWKWEERNLFSVHEEALSFSAFEQATEIMLYNAVQIWLIGLLWRLAPLDTPAIISSAAQVNGLQKFHTTPLSLPGSTYSFPEPAIEICRVFEYQCLNVYHSRDSAMFYMLPIGLAYSVWGEESQYQDWIQSMLDLSPVTKGYVLGQNFMGFGFYLSSYSLQETIAKV